MALAKQVAAFNHLNVIANNVANANTKGFMEDKMVFKGYITTDTKDKISFPNDIATTINLQPGSLTLTQRALDVAINGQGFFIVRTLNGVRYTRNGNFHINSENMLVDGKGNPVLSGDMQEILFEEGDGTPLILENGTVLVDGEERGIIGVAEFANPKLLRKTLDGMLISEVPHLTQEEPKIVQGTLEDSNVNQIAAMTKLIEVQQDVTRTSNLINDMYNMQRSSYKVYSKIGG